jgi:vacuolar-type H+-ATPase subunit I/STV1
MKRLNYKIKKQALLTGFMLSSLTFYSFGQSQTTAPKETIPTVVSSNTSLSAQRAKIEAKQTQISQSISTSRAQMNELNVELNALKEEYLRMLKLELEKTADEKVKEQLQAEITRFSTQNKAQIR